MKHEAMVLKRTDERWRPACICGWAAPPTDTAAEATTEAGVHAADPLAEWRDADGNFSTLWLACARRFGCEPEELSPGLYLTWARSTLHDWRGSPNQ